MDDSSPTVSTLGRRARRWCGAAALLLLGLSLAEGRAAQVPASWEADGYRHLRTLTVSDGLPQSTVSSIVQTRDGFIWFGTFGGLVRFDGVEVTVFRETSQPALEGNRIVSLCEGRDGSLWIGTDSHGVSRYRDGVFTHFGSEDGAPKGPIWSIVEAPDGSVWFGGIGISRWADGQLAAVERARGGALGTTSMLAVSGDGTVWGATTAGLLRLEDGRLHRVEWSDGRPYQKAWLVASDSSGVTWAWTSAGFARVGAQGLEPLEDGGGPTFGPSFLQTGHDHRGRTLLSTSTGLYSVELEGDSIGFSACLPGDEAHAMARSFLHDREGILWVALGFNGVSQFVRNEFVEIARPSRPDRRILVANDGGDGLYCAADEPGGLWHLSEQGYVRPAWGQELLSGGRVLSLASARDGALWLQQESGLVRVEEGRLERFPHPAMHAMHAIWGAPLLEDDSGGIWCSTQRGLQRFADGEYVDHSSADALLQVVPQALIQARDGALWIAARNEVGRLAGEDFRKWTVEDGLPRGAIRTLLQTPDGDIWVGTYGGGLALLVDQRFEAVDSSRGLYDDFVSRVEEDGQGSLCVNSNRGVFRVGIAGLASVARGESSRIVCQPLGTEEAGGGFGCGLPDASLVFETIRGLVVIAPAGFKTVSVPPVVVMLSVECGDRTIALPASVELALGERDLLFHFTAPTFRTPQNMTYRYRIVGLDDEWQGPTSQRQARYTRVPPGSYRFEVQASTGGVFTSMEPSGVGFIVPPYVHETSWFLAASVLAVLVLLAGGLRVYTRRVRQRNRELRTEVDGRTRAETTLRALASRLIGSQEAERMRIARELHDDVSQRLALLCIDLDVLCEDSKEQPGSASPAKLEELAERVRGISGGIHDLSYRLHPAKLNQLGLLHALRSLCREVSEQRGLAVEYNSSGIELPIPEDISLCLFRIAQESLRNAVRHSGAESARVEVNVRADAIALVVSDSGKGFAHEPMSHEGGLGHVSMRERVRLVRGKITIRSSPGTGTRIEVEVPMTTAAAESEP